MAVWKSVVYKGGALGTPASGTLTNCDGMAGISGIVADASMPNLTGDVTTVEGAVATTIANDAVSLAKMAGLARGKVIYGNSSGNPAALSVGTNGQVLTTDGTDLSWGDTSSGDLTGVTVGEGITGSSLTGPVPDIVLDLTELPANTDTLVAADQFVIIEDGDQGKMACSEINLGVFNNDQSWTANAGTVTSITPGVGLNGTSAITSSGTLHLDFSELTDMSGDVAGSTLAVLQDGSTESTKPLSEIKLSYFNNNSSWTANAGTVTSVDDGNGLTGGAITTTGSLTVGAGAGITVNTDDVAVTAAQTGITSLTNTGLVIGRDADNVIKFATDNEMHFFLAGADELTITAGQMTPSTSSGLDLGTPSKKWRHGEFGGDVTVVGTVVAADLTISGTTSTVGTVTSGIWNGTAINQTYLVGQSGTNTGDNTVCTSGAATTAAGLTGTPNITVADITCANISVSDTMTHTAAEQMSLEDSVILLNSGLSSSTAYDAGIFVERDTANAVGSVSNDNNPGLYWDESAGYFGFAEQTGGVDVTSAPITPNAYMGYATSGNSSGNTSKSPLGSVHINTSDDSIWIRVTDA